MKPTLKINTKNKFENELWHDGKLVAHGGSGLENVELKQLHGGKRMAAILTLTNVNVIISDTECPEKHRYGKIEECIQDHTKFKNLELVCDMLKIDQNACDGCPWQPNRTSTQDVAKRMSMVAGKA